MLFAMFLGLITLTWWIKDTQTTVAGSLKLKQCMNARHLAHAACSFIQRSYHASCIFIMKPKKQDSSLQVHTSSLLSAMAYVPICPLCNGIRNYPLLKEATKVYFLLFLKFNFSWVTQPANFPRIKCRYLNDCFPLTCFWQPTKNVKCSSPMNAKVCIHNIQLSPFHVQRHKNGELLQKESSIPDNTSERGTAFIQVSLFSGWRTWCLSSFSSSSYYNSRWYVLCIIFFHAKLATLYVL